ncbi:unnamed protein product [Ectocarpus sp. 8 AP-2014]
MAVVVAVFSKAGTTSAVAGTGVAVVSTNCPNASTQLLPVNIGVQVPAAICGDALATTRRCGINRARALSWSEGFKRNNTTTTFLDTIDSTATTASPCRHPLI